MPPQVELTAFQAQRAPSQLVWSLWPAHCESLGQAMLSLLKLVQVAPLGVQVLVEVGQS